MSYTIAQLLQQGSQQLSAHSDSARLDSEILLAYCLNEDRSYLYTWPERQPATEQTNAFLTLIERRIEGEPIAYLVGQQEFWSMPLKVTPQTLIPRPETELLVELALERIPVNEQQRILDLGTGSGAIALAIARERPDCQVIGLDQSQQALIIAKDNAATLNITNVTFIHGHWFRSLPSEQRYDLIVSNPPYIAEHDPHLSEGDVRFEPSSALTSGSDGLDDIREIADQARTFLVSGGWLMLEHGYDQAAAIKQLLTSLAYQQITEHHDLAGQPRVVVAQHP